MGMVKWPIKWPKTWENNHPFTSYFRVPFGYPGFDHQMMATFLGGELGNVTFISKLPAYLGCWEQACEGWGLKRKPYGITSSVGQNYSIQSTIQGQFEVYVNMWMGKMNEWNWFGHIISGKGEFLSKMLGRWWMVLPDMTLVVPPLGMTKKSHLQPWAISTQGMEIQRVKTWSVMIWCRYSPLFIKKGHLVDFQVVQMHYLDNFQLHFWTLYLRQIATLKRWKHDGPVMKFTILRIVWCLLNSACF